MTRIGLAAYSGGRVGKAALAPCPPSIGSHILNGGHASTFALRASVDAFAHPTHLRNREAMSANERDTNTLVVDCLAACLLLTFGPIGNFNRSWVFSFRAAAVMRNDTDTGVGIDRVAARPLHLSKETGF